MKRSNTFKVMFKHPDIVMNRAVGCATLWNKLNYRRRQSFFNRGIDWEWKDLYSEFKGWIGSATAQQIVRKNNGAWKSFFTLLKLKSEGKLPPHIEVVRPPRYWKDRDTGELTLIYIVKNQNYRIEGRNIHFPFKLKGRIKGKPRWNGKQGEIELIYDRSKGCWYAHQSVETEQLHQPRGHKTAFVDLGVRYPITAIIESRDKPIAYSGKPLLSDWWYWNKRIGKHQSVLKTVNDCHKSRQLSKLYRVRQRRFRQAINTYIHRFVEHCWNSGVGEIVAGDLTSIRNNGSKGKKTNAMVNNFWSHKYTTDRLRYTAENYGIKLSLIDENGTSSVCPRCGNDHPIKRGRLFKCKQCGLEAHRDVVGAWNISLVHRDIPLGEGGGNWAMASPEVVNLFGSSHTNNLEGIPLR